MTTASTSLTLTSNKPTTEDPAIFVTLEQDEPPDTQKHLSIKDLYRMWMRAIDGLSAQKYRPQDCPIMFDGDTVKIYFEFFAMPSSKDLEYDLSASVGEIGDAKIETLPRDQDIIFPMSDYYQLDFLPIALDLSWQTGCWKPGCVEVDPPDLEINGTLIELSEVVFGVARLAGTAYAEKYILTIELEKGDNRIKGLEPVIIASWIGADGKTETEELQIEVPACVTFALEMCDGEGGTIHCDNSEPAWPVLYYSVCDGSLVTILEGEDVEGWCDEVDV